MPDAPRPRDDSDDPDDPDDDARDTFAFLGDDTPDGVVRNEDADGWRFELVDADDADAAADQPPLEPGSPSAENVFFVLVGVALMLILVLSVFVPIPFVA